MKARMMSIRCPKHGRMEPCFVCTYDHEMKELEAQAKRRWNMVLGGLVLALLLVLAYPYC